VRNRRLNFPTLVLYLLNLRKQSSQIELDQFFKHLDEQKQSAQVITKSAFFQARKQLSHTAFTAINHQLIETLYQHPGHLKTWRGFRLCAVDGTSIRLPEHPEIINTFGLHHGKPGQAGCAMGMASVFYDVLNHLVIDSSLCPKGTSERACAVEHLAHAQKNDLILYDRGYPAFWLYAFHLKQKQAFCMRATTHRSTQVSDFIKSKQQEAIITIEPNKPSIKTCQKKGLSSQPVKLRLIRVDLPNEVEVLITNLMDSKTYEAKLFKSLYHLRWGIEENYKRLKQWLEIENFSGKSALSIKQDFYAKIVASNLTAIMALAGQKKVKKKTEHCQKEYQINFAQTVSKMKHHLVRFILQATKGIQVQLEHMIDYISQSTEALRKGRAYPRRMKNIKNDIHFPAYKSAL